MSAGLGETGELVARRLTLSGADVILLGGFSMALSVVHVPASLLRGRGMASATDSKKSHLLPGASYISAMTLVTPALHRLPRRAVDDPCIPLKNLGGMSPRRVDRTGIRAETLMPAAQHRDHCQQRRTTRPTSSTLYSHFRPRLLSLAQSSPTAV